MKGFKFVRRYENFSFGERPRCIVYNKVYRTGKHFFSLPIFIFRGF